ncbi:MAG: acetolactate synthase small subunit [Candidatus Omnitrophica bacterium]|nr:acetolactate synthase small subunit [Candidatus Omnitrophota bacterium]
MSTPIQPKKNVHTISLLVANKPGVLVRIALMFARRSYNIDSLVVSPSFNEKFSRMTITAQGDLQTLEQIIKQANKLIDVIHASEHNNADAVHNELALMKIKFTPANKPIILKLLKKSNASVIDTTGNIMVISQAGTTPELDELEAALKKYHLIEMVRTGKVAMARGHDET